MLWLLLESVLVGAVVSAIAFGPTNLIAMRHTVRGNTWNGIMVGFGSSLADLTYACIPAFGISFIATYLDRWQGWLNGGAAVLLIAMGIMFARKGLAFDAKQSTRFAKTGAFGAGYMLNVINPGNVVAYGYGFSVLNIATDHFNLTASIIVALGVFLGSLLSWAGKIWLFIIARGKVTDKRLEQAFKLIGWLMVAAGAFILVWKVLL